MRSLHVLFLLWLFGFSLLKAEKKPDQGILHLSENDLKKEKLLSLDGQWNFYWGTTFEEYRQNKNRLVPRLLNVPGNWGSLGYPRYGFGTYVLRVVCNQKERIRLGMWIPSVCNAYRLHINHSLLAKAGHFSTEKQKSQPEYFPQEVYFQPRSDTLEIAFEISNFHYREGGLNYTPRIGSASAVQYESRKSLIINSFVIGLLTLVAVYFLAFYLGNLNDKKAFYFALLCLSAAVRQASVTECIVLKQFCIALPWEWLVKLEFISLFGIMNFAVLYFSYLFEEEKNKVILYSVSWINGILTLFIFFFPASITSFVIPPFLLFSFAILLYLLFISIKTVYLKRKFSIWFLIGYVSIFICGINDILYSQELISSTYMLPAGIISFVFVNVVMLTLLFADTFHAIERLSLQLEEANKNQKQILFERTVRLSEKTWELERLNEVKDKIFSIIAHDLRSPVKTLSAFLTIAAVDNTLTVSELKTHLKKIQRDTESLNLTLDNLLMWSRNQIQGASTHASDLEVVHLITQCLDLYRLPAENKGVSIKSAVPEGLYLHADKDHMSLVLRNIIGNALKFTNPGGHISISSRIHDHYVQIIIEDTGIGIPKQHLENMFNPANHYTTHGTTNEKGTGLGLQLCKEYLEKNNGIITIKSESGEGTRVCLEIPATKELFD